MKSLKRLLQEKLARDIVRNENLNLIYGRRTRLHEENWDDLFPGNLGQKDLRRLFGRLFQAFGVHIDQMPWHGVLARFSRDLEHLVDAPGHSAMRLFFERFASRNVVGEIGYLKDGRVLGWVKDPDRGWEWQWLDPLYPDRPGIPMRPQPGPNWQPGDPIPGEPIYPPDNPPPWVKPVNSPEITPGMLNPKPDGLNINPGTGNPSGPPLGGPPPGEAQGPFWTA